MVESSQDWVRPPLAESSVIKPGFQYTANAMTTTQKQSVHKVEQSPFTLKPGFHYTANATTTTQKQSNYRVEQSSLTLIVLFWLEIGRCRRRN